MDLDHALEAHVAWKVRFRMAIFEQGSVDVEGAGREDFCELGRWMRTEGLQGLGGRPDFQACMARHREFHFEAGRIARAINAGRLEEAGRLMKPSAAFTLSSAALGRALVDLMRAARTEECRGGEAGS